MTLTALPLPDSPALAWGRLRRDRLTRGETADPHPVLGSAYRASADRLADMRLPEGGGLVISPSVASLDCASALHGGHASDGIANRPLQYGDVFPPAKAQTAVPVARSGAPDTVYRPPKKRSGLFQRLGGWLGVLDRTDWPDRADRADRTGKAIRLSPISPTASGRFETLSDGQQSFVVDLGGLLVGWPMAAWFAEMARLLKPGGVYICATLGPTSLAPLWDAMGRPVPASPFWYDLHDLGDAMAAAGLAAPVAESDRLTFSYRRAEQAWADIRDFPIRPYRAHGAQSKGFLGRRACRQVWAALESQRGEDGRIALGVELVIVHAWKPEMRPQGGSGAADPVKTVTWHPKRTG